MPFLTAEALTATAPGAFSKTLEKPTGKRVIITAIHLTSDKNPKFIEVKVYLYRIDKTTHVLGVLHKWAVSLENMSWDVYREWPEGWKMIVKFTTQTNADKSIATIEYKIVEEPKKRRWF